MRFKPSKRIPSAFKASKGYTLVEIMIAVAITLVILGLLIKAFTSAGNAISKARSIIELSDELATASNTIRNDLRNATATMNPPTVFGNDEGYFEILEDVGTDGTYGPSGPLFGSGEYTAYGDVDDVVMFTVRSLDEPFRGRFNGQIIESKVAEVIYWTVVNDKNGNSTLDLNLDETVTLYRRVLLVRDDLNDENANLVEDNDVNGGATTGPFPVTTTIQQFLLGGNDVSVRLDQNGLLTANSLTDLTKRENRFAHHTLIDPIGTATSSFPFAINRNTLIRYVLPGTRTNQGEDVLLSNIAAFDVRIFDPEALIIVAVNATPTSPVLQPGDTNYGNEIINAISSGRVVSKGAFVDLGHGYDPIALNQAYTHGPFSALPTVYSQFGTVRGYCTWSTHYESDGIDQDESNGAAPAWKRATASGEMVIANQVDDDSDGEVDEAIDEGTDGLDNNGIYGPDDETERETSPPYPFPLRGIKITLRVIEKSSQQVRQSSVEHSFVP